MATLASHIADLAAAVRDKLNQHAPRLLPSGGTTGQILRKTTATNYDTSWIDPPSGSDPWTRVGLAADVVSALATFADITGFKMTPAANTNFTIEGEILLVTSGTTNMPRIQVSVGAGQAYWAVDIEWQASATTKTYSEGQGTTASGLISIPVGTAIVATPTPFLVKYTVKGRSGSAPGAISIQLAAETAGANAAIAKVGSEFRYRTGP